MIINKKTALIVSSFLVLTGCSKITGIFEKDDAPPLEGKRISVLELQKSLEPDKAREGQNLITPEAWNNEFWPQSGGYPNHSMQNPVLPKELKNVWKTDIGSGSTDELPLTSQPIVAEGKIYTMDTSANISAFSSQNGKLIWKVSIDNDDEDDAVIRGGLAYSDKSIYATNGYEEIFAIDALNGNIKWKKSIPSASRTSPTVIDNRIYITTLDNRLIALDSKNGDTLWSYLGIGESAGLLGAASPAANSDVVVPVFSSGEVTALRVENGSVAWTDNLASVRSFGGGLESLSEIRAMPILDKGLVIVLSFGGKLAAIDERTGSRIWQREISGAETPWTAGNSLYVLSVDQQLIALNLDDGSIIWVTQLPKYEDEDSKDKPLSWNAPIMASGRLIMISSEGNVIEFNSQNGKIITKWDTDRPVSITPVVAGKTLYILSNDGTLMAYR